MKNIEFFTEFVKAQVSFHETKAARYEKRSDTSETDRRRAAAHRQMAERFSELLDFLKSPKMSEGGVTAAGRTVTRLGLTADELEGLPEELLSELSITESDKADFNVISIVEEAGGVLSLDKILIGLFRKTGEIVRRTQLNSRIYRMIQRETMFSVPGRKGVYSLKPLTEEEAANLQ